MRIMDFPLTTVLALLAGSSTATTALAADEAARPAAADPRVTYARQVLAAYQQGAPRNHRALHVAYFCPTDCTPAPDYQARLTQVLEAISRFYATQMRQYGLPSDGIPLDTNTAGQVVVHLVSGKHPASEYSEAKSADEIRNDVQPVMEAVGVELRNNHVVVFTRLGHFDGTNTWHNSPYCGMGWANSGFCWQFDSDLLSVPNLLVTNRWVTDRQYGHITFGRYNSIFIGGTAHELGHCFGLPHNSQSDEDLRTRGHALMGDGNRHLREELRGEGKGSFLTLAHALALAANPLFSHVEKGLDEKWECTLDQCETTVTNGTVRIAGRFKSNQPIYGVIAYRDPTGHGDYDAPTSVGTVMPDDTFSITLDSLPNAKSDGEIRVCLLSASGQHLNAAKASRATFSYEVDADGRVEVQRK